METRVSILQESPNPNQQLQLTNSKFKARKSNPRKEVRIFAHGSLQKRLLGNPNLNFQQPEVGHFGLSPTRISKGSYKKAPQIPEHPNSHVPMRGKQRDITNSLIQTIGKKNSSNSLALRFLLKIRFQETKA